MLHNVFPPDLYVTSISIAHYAQRVNIQAYLRGHENKMYKLKVRGTYIMKQTFIKGTLILIAASLVTRALGFVYRIFLSRIIGAEGMGLFQLAFPILMLILTFVTAGLPVAISKLVAEAAVQGARRRIRRILYASFLIVTILSIFFTFLLLQFAPYIAENFLQDDRAYYAMLAMSPIIGIAAISSILRGYFQGLQNMNPSALSQIFEQIVRITTVIYFANLWLPKGVEYAAAGAMVGMVCGEFTGLLILLAYYLRYKNRPLHSGANAIPQRQTRRQVLYRIVETALPVTFSKAIGSVTYALEPIIIAKSLAIAGIAVHQATAYYGQLAGMVIPLLMFPTVFTYSLSVTLIPSISEANALHNMQTIGTRVRQSIHFALIIGVYFSIILFTQAERLGEALYNQPEIKTSLQILALFGIFLYLQSPLAGILQGLGKAKQTMYNSLAGSIIKLTAIYFLASRPSLHIQGAVIAVVIGALTVTLLHLRITKKYVPVRYPLADISKFLLIGLIMFCLSSQLSKVLTAWNPWLALTVILPVTLLAYSSMLLIGKLVTFEDFIRFRLIRK